VRKRGAKDVKAEYSERWKGVKKKGGGGGREKERKAEDMDEK